MPELTRERLSSLLCKWWEDSQGGPAAEIQEMVDSVEDDALEEINQRLNRGENFAESVYDVLSEEAVLSEDEEIRGSFIDYCEELDGRD